MKVVINNCYGGFGLSPLALKALAKLEGKECYFFDYKCEKELSLLEATESIFVYACTVKNPKDYDRTTRDEDGTFTTANNNSELIGINDHSDDRANPKLISVVESLGKLANGKYSDLSIVTIPDDVKYTIEEYDGMKHIAEEHKTWR